MSTITGAPGTLGILNVGHGDTKLTFDPNNPAECIRAARIVKDMLRRGYALMVEAQEGDRKIFKRVHDFDDQHFEYIIADFDPMIAAAQDDSEETEDAGSEPVKRGPGRPKGRRLPASGARGVAIARSAGG